MSEADPKVKGVICGFEDCQTPWIESPFSLVLSTELDGRKIKIAVCEACGKIFRQESAMGQEFTIVRGDGASIEFTGVPGQVLIHPGRPRVRRVPAPPPAAAGETP